MQLTELAMHNIGTYKGRQVIDLTTTPERPIILIGGLNGCGKTTLLDALQLVLYGNRARLSNRGTQPYEEYLRSTISRTADPKGGATISLTFLVTTEGVRHQYKVVRSWASTGRRIKEALDVFLDGEWSKALSANWADHIEDLLPLEIAGLFFFDGERIEALADPDRASSVIQTAVHSLLGASTLDQLRTDLLALQRRQMPESGDAVLDQRLADLVEQHARLEDDIERTEERLLTIKSDLEAARRAASQAQSDFSRVGGDLFEQRATFATQRASAQAELDVVRSELRALADGALPLALLGSQLESVVAQTRSEEQAATSQRLLELLGQRDAWLLGQLPTSSATLARALLERDREERAASAVESYLDLGEGAEVTLARLAAEVHRSVDEAKKLLARSRQLSGQVEELDSMLAGVPSEESVRQAQDAYTARLQAVSHLEGQQSVVDEDRRQLLTTKDTLEAQLATVESERIRVSVANDDVRRILEYTERVRVTLQELREKLIRRHLTKIEVATIDSFRSLMRKDGLVADLRINPETYAVMLTSSSGHAIDPSRLSAGERQLLAVAILWGLARVAGNRLPTVVDTPLGRLDSVHRRHLVERYFPYASGQTLLLSTDEEIDQGLYEDLSPWICHEYLLVHDEAEDATRVEPGYWWEREQDDVA